jgi:hypothetical protein
VGHIEVGHRVDISVVSLSQRESLCTKIAAWRRRKQLATDKTSLGLRELQQFSMEKDFPSISATQTCNSMLMDEIFMLIEPTNNELGLSSAL